MNTNRMPVPLNRPGIPPPFPDDYLPPVVREYVKAVAENLNISVDMPAAYSLAVLSLCCQQKAKIRATTTWSEELNMYVCIVADPSELKSPTFNAMIKPVNDYVAEYNKAHAAEIITAQDMLDSLILQKNKLKAKSGNEQEILHINRQIANMEIPKYLRLITTDSTNEALAEMLFENHGAIGVMCDEGGIFQNISGLYSDNQSNINSYLCGYDGNPILIHRKSGNIEIPRATITMGIFCQKKVLADVMANTSLTGKGLTQRFAFCMPESKVGRRDLRERDPENFLRTQAEYSQLIRKLLAMPMTDKDTCLTLDYEARAAFADYYSVIEHRMAKGGEYEDYRDYFGKMAGRTLRIAGLIHLAKYQDIKRPVDIETMTSAYIISEYFAEQTKLVLGYDKYDDSPRKLLDAMLEMCRKEHTDTLNVSCIKKKIRNKLSEQQFNDAVELLENKGYIAHIKPERTRFNNRNLGAFKLNNAWLESKEVTIGQKN